MLYFPDFSPFFCKFKSLQRGQNALAENIAIYVKEYCFKQKI